MITITINNEDRTYDSTPQAVMSIAWEGRKLMAEKFDCKVSEIHWGECLKMTWEVVKKVAKVAVEAICELTIAEKLEEMWHAQANRRSTYTKWEYGFICDNLSRVEKYGEKTNFSEKQVNLIEKLYSKSL